MIWPWAISLICTVAAIPAVMTVARGHFLDVPNQRSSHVKPTPRLGGVGIILGCVVGYLAAMSSSRTLIQGTAIIAITAALAGTLGFIDDFRPLPAGRRLVFQLLLGAAVSVGMYMAAVFAWPIAALLGVLVIPVFINAVNFMDGINGITGAVMFLNFATHVGLYIALENKPLATVAGIAASATLAFLPYNFPHPATFLGDSGSYFLGALLGASTLSAFALGANVGILVAPLAVYATDTSMTLLRRLRSGKNIIEAHRDHAYQHLARRAGHTRATILITTFTIFLLLMAIHLRDAPPYFVTPALILAAGTFTSISYRVCAR